MAVLELLYRGTRYRVAELGRIPKTVSFRILQNHPEALVQDSILIVRILDSLYFTNWYPCEEAIQYLMDKHSINLREEESRPLGVVMNMISCGKMDATAAFGIKDFSKKCAKQGIAVRLSCVSDSVLHV